MRMLLLAGISVVMQTSPGFARDPLAISVTVNGRTYQCNGDGGGSFAYYCKCHLADSFWRRIAIGYFKVNQETGEETKLRDLQDYGNNSTDRMQQCEQDLQKHPLCRSGRP